MDIVEYKEVLNAFFSVNIHRKHCAKRKHSTEKSKIRCKHSMFTFLTNVYSNVYGANSLTKP
jgi:hypothetical protein